MLGTPSVNSRLCNGYLIAFEPHAVPSMHRTLCASPVCRSWFLILVLCYLGRMLRHTGSAYNVRCMLGIASICNMVHINDTITIIDTY